MKTHCVREHSRSTKLFLEIPDWLYSNQFTQENICTRRLRDLTLDVTEGKMEYYSSGRRALWVPPDLLAWCYTCLNTWSWTAGTLGSGLRGLPGLLPGIWGHKFLPPCLPHRGVLKLKLPWPVSQFLLSSVGQIRGFVIVTREVTKYIWQLKCCWSGRESCTWFQFLQWHQLTCHKHSH